MRISMQKVGLAVVGLAVLGGAMLTPTACTTGDSQTPNNSSGRTTTQPGSGRESDALRKYPLDSLPTSTVSINGHVIRVWVAAAYDRDRPGVTNEGLMHVPMQEIEDDQGMLFIFSQDQPLSFWMKNTLTPLDIAFVRSDGKIVTTWQMPALTLSSFPSTEPAKFALEVKQGTFATLGINEGDTMTVPPELLKPAR